MKEGIPMYKRILVAVDGSENSHRAAKHAAQLASLCPGVAVEVLYILEFDRTRSDVLDNASSDDLHIDRKKRLIPIEEAFEQFKSPISLSSNTVTLAPSSFISPIAVNSTLSFLVAGV